MSNSEKSSDDLLSKLDILIRLTAANLIKDRDLSEQDQVAFLDRIGLQPKEIAFITGKTLRNVHATLSNIRKKEGLVKKAK